MKRFLLACTATLFLVGVIGCGERTSTLNAEGDQGLFRPATEAEVSATEYRVAPPDELRIKAPNIKEIDAFQGQIRPDGKISLNLLNEVYVAGQTPEEISQLLTKMAEKYYVNPDIRVEVVGYNSKYYFMFGQVYNPGKKSFTGRDTVVSALAEAGFNDSAWPQQVSVSRPAKPGREAATAIVDLKKMYMTGDMTQNYLLEEGDVINIPDSPLAAWNKGMNRVLGPVTGAETIGTTPQRISDTTND